MVILIAVSFACIVRFLMAFAMVIPVFIAGAMWFFGMLAAVIISVCIAMGFAMFAARIAVRPAMPAAMRLRFLGFLTLLPLGDALRIVEH